MRLRLAALLLGPWLVVVPWPIAAAGEFAGERRGAAPIAFAHADHVINAWFTGAPESQRDCRGCHLYTKDGLPVDPQAIRPDPVGAPTDSGCAVCHTRTGGKFAVQASPPFDKDLSAVRAEGSVVFEHGDHLRLTCRECHRPANKFAPDPLPIQAGSRACGACHGDGGRRDFELLAGETAVPDERSSPSLTSKGFAAALDQRLSKPIGAGKFRHQDHLLDPNAAVPLADLLAGKATCTFCHPARKDLDAAGFAETRFMVDACGTCHIGAEGALQFATQQIEGTSAAATTFRHGDHVRAAMTPQACSPEARKRIDDEGCGACHGLALDANGFDQWSLPDVGGPRTKASSYEGCVVCHTPDAWRTRIHDDWQRCEACHVFPSASMQNVRPHTTVRRSAKLAFTIEVQAHPHITTADRADPQAQACADCHRAPVATLPSRIQTKAFDHASHPTDCARCHAPVAAATGAATLGVAQAGQPGEDPGYRTFDLAKCGDCHRGGAVVVAQEEFRTKDVPWFAHSDHVAAPGQPDKKRKNGETIGCATCHHPNEDGTSFTVPDDKSCADCHGHDDERAPETKGLGPADAGSCGKCHGAAAPPLAPASVPMARLGLQTFAGAQVHDPAVTKKADCKDCHIAPEPVLLATDHVFAADGWSKGGEERHLDGDALRDPKDPALPSHCEGCHWEKTALLTQAHNEFLKFLPRPIEIRPPTAAERAGAMGASLQLFPGPRATPNVTPR